MARSSLSPELQRLNKALAKVKAKKRIKRSVPYPIQTKMPMQTSAGGPNAIIRVDRALSAVNHRLYRQSRMYHAKVDLDANAQQGTVVTVWALADTWWTQKAYQLAYETFLENSKEESAQLKETQARWNDFRVDHGLSGFVEMLPSGSTSPTGTPTQFGTTNAEYLMSEVHDAGGTAATFRWTGTGANTWNIVDQYDNTGNTDQSPTSAAGTVAYDGLTDELDSGQTSHLTDDGNQPPYNRTNLENHVWIKVGTLVASLNNTDKLSTGYFKAPCGLIALTKSSPFVETGTVVNLEVKSGDYKGVAAQSYLE
jgi:hypothetical protein